MKIALLCLLVAASSALPEEERQGKGLFTDLVKLWGGFSDTLDQFQEKAEEEVESLKPMLKKADDEFSSAMDDLKTKFDTVADSLGSVVEERFGTVNRNDEGDVVIDSDHSIVRPFVNIFDQGMMMNPFDIFRRQGLNWYDGPNVCVETKIFEPNEESSPESGESVAESLPQFFSMASSFESCSNGPNFHECKSVRRDRNGERTKVVRKQCCYGFVRSENESEGCVKRDMKTLKDTVKDMEAKEFMLLVEATNLNDMLEANHTVFVPSDDAIEEFRHELGKLNKVEVKKKTLLPFKSDCTSGTHILLFVVPLLSEAELAETNSYEVFHEVVGFFWIQR